MDIYIDIDIYIYIYTIYVYIEREIRHNHNDTNNNNNSNNNNDDTHNGAHADASQAGNAPCSDAPTFLFEPGKPLASLADVFQKHLFRLQGMWMQGSACSFSEVRHLLLLPLATCFLWG